MSPRVNLLLGLAALSLAAIETLTGQSLGGYGSTADRAVNPKVYWSNVGTTYLVALLLIGRYLYRIDWAR